MEASRGQKLVTHDYTHIRTLYELRRVGRVYIYNFEIIPLLCGSGRDTDIII